MEEGGMTRTSGEALGTTAEHPALSTGTTAVRSSGLQAQGIPPGQWAALGKSCYCVSGNPVIIVFAVMISVFIAISLGKSVPTCVLYGETFLEKYIR